MRLCGPEIELLRCNITLLRIRGQSLNGALHRKYTQSNFETFQPLVMSIRAFLISSADVPNGK